MRLVTSFGQVTVLVRGEVVKGEPAGHGGRERTGFDHRSVAGVGECGARVAGAVGGVTQHPPQLVMAMKAQV
jgi:hypothetical protein